MKILHLAKTDFGEGGAPMAAVRIHQSLLKHGLDSSMLVEQKCSGDNTIIEMPCPTDPVSILARKMRSFMIKTDLKQVRPDVEIFSHDRSRYGDILSQVALGFDIIHLHWVSSFLDHPNFFKRLTDRKLCWTLHDMNPFTGGCHFTHGCEKFKSRCGACPQLTSNNQDDLSQRIWQGKMTGLSHLRRDQLTVVSTCRWMSEQAKVSSLLSSFRHQLIPLGIELQSFRPYDQSTSRATFQIKEGSKVIAFVCKNLHNPRKGYAVLKESLGSYSARNSITLLHVGDGEVDIPGVHTLSTGTIRDETLLAKAYSAADLTVIPSLQETSPLVAIESLACGTPVVSFPVGIIPDLVESEKTGFMSQDRTATGFEKMIEHALSSNLAGMREPCRQAAQQFSLERQLADYLNLYNQMLL